VIEDPRPEEVGEDLVHLLRQALHLGLEAIRAHGQPMVPFVALESDGERRVEVFRPEGDGEVTSDACMDLMKERAPLLAFEAERMAVVYDGYLELDEDQRRESVFAEGIERGMGTSVTVAQSYTLVGRRRRKLRKLGEPILLEQGRHFIR
jgi:hypothetical protein